VTEDGLFDGTISTLLEDFYIEPVSRYVKQNSRTPNFHTIVYRSSDVSTPQLTQPCASQLLHLNNMASRETIEGRTASALREGKHVNSSGNNWNSEINEDWTLTSESNRSNGKGCAEGKGLSDINKSSKINRLNEVAHREQAANIIDTVHKIDRKKGGGVGGGKDCVSNKVIGSDGTRGAGCAAVGHSHKTKRSDRWSSDEASHTADSMYGSTTTRNASRLDTYYYNPNVFVNGSLPSAALTDEVFAVRHVHKRATVDPKKTTCMLYLQADHLFYQKYGTEEACIEVMTRHVQRVNSIYKTTGKLHC
jgi:disintegrin and metalloproteinase domain-containing protein 10